MDYSQMSGLFMLPVLDDVLVPLKGAAGFTIGDSRSSIESRIGSIEWHNSGINVLALAARSKSWIGIVGDDQACTLVYGDFIVRLVFSSVGVLFNIEVGKGYLGSFMGIRVGDHLSALERQFVIEYDDGDEQFYISDKYGIDIFGISFSGNFGVCLETVPDQCIDSISIHDWNLMK